MDDKEWTQIAGILGKWWKGEFDPDTEEVYKMMLDSYDQDRVLAALARLTETGRPFLPTGPEIVAAMREDPSWPSWTEVFDALRAVGRAGLLGPYGDREKAMAMLTAAHPVVAGFANREGLRRLHEAPFEDPDYGELEAKRWEDRFAEYAATIKGRQRAGMSLEQAVGWLRLPKPAATTGLTRLDPAAAIEGESSKPARGDEALDKENPKTAPKDGLRLAEVVAADHELAVAEDAHRRAGEGGFRRVAS